ncbi:MAG: hypothetical protein JOY80_11075 [Candidatus Dormibacteraeota bacterium]|nr:hypothetical protein [Candidatus Dormibacteraeota bacterium]
MRRCRGDDCNIISHDSYNHDDIDTIPRACRAGASFDTHGYACAFSSPDSNASTRVHRDTVHHPATGWRRW